MKTFLVVLLFLLLPLALFFMLGLAGKLVTLLEQQKNLKKIKQDRARTSAATLSKYLRK